MGGPFFCLFDLEIFSQYFVFDCLWYVCYSCLVFRLLCLVGNVFVCFRVVILSIFLYNHTSSDISPLRLVSNSVASTVQYYSNQSDRGWKALNIPHVVSLVKPVCS